MNFSRNALLQLSKCTNMSVFLLQVNITIENVEMVVNSLTEIVVMATKPVDQNSDNIQIINTVIFEIASLLRQTFVKGNLALEVI